MIGRKIILINDELQMLQMPSSFFFLNGEDVTGKVPGTGCTVSAIGSTTDIEK
jgi:hypothetical protein